MDEPIEKILERFPANKQEFLIPILQELQKENGFLTHDGLEHVGRYLGIPSNKIFGVATFYDQFRFKSRGKHHIQVCQGTNCYLAGGPTLLEEVEKVLQVKAGNTTRDGRFSLEAVTCLGGCTHAPVIMIDGRPHRNFTSATLPKLFASIKE